MKFSIDHLIKKTKWSIQRHIGIFVVRCSNIRYDLKLLFNIKNILIINSWVCFRKGKIQPRNFGDDLNYYIFEKLTDKTIRFYHCTFLSAIKRTNVVCIGSVIHNCNKNSIIWGGGLISGDSRIPAHPRNVTAVRGPKTRERLIQAGIQCPEVYGDPALLLPFVYTPRPKTAASKTGIVFNAADEHCGNEFLKRMDCPFTLISMTNYTSWEKVVDSITGCDLILSSSLHGLIVSDAYNIPNIWISFNDNKNIIGGDFKYLDYLESVNRHQDRPIELEAIINDGVDQYLHLIEKPDYDLNPLVDSCPFELNINNAHKHSNK